MSSRKAGVVFLLWIRHCVYVALLLCGFIIIKVKEHYVNKCAAYAAVL